MIEEKTTEARQVVKRKSNKKPSSPKKAKQKLVKSKPVDSLPLPTVTTTKGRVTRSKINGTHTNLLVSGTTITSNPDNHNPSRKALLEQERKDFEYAKRIQRQLNQESHVVTTGGYSLRRSSGNSVPISMEKESKTKSVAIY